MSQPEKLPHDVLMELIVAEAKEIVEHSNKGNKDLAYQMLTWMDRMCHILEVSFLSASDIAGLLNQLEEKVWLVVPLAQFHPLRARLVQFRDAMRIRRPVGRTCL